MPAVHDKESRNEDYINFLNELRVIDNTASNNKKNIKCNFKGRKFVFNKYLMIS